MKSDICKLSNDTVSLENALKEAEKIAVYAGLDAKQTGRLRLLAEELIGMVPSLLAYADGDFWIEAEGKNFTLHVSLTPSSIVNAEKREKLLAVSSSGKNAAAVGIMNKIRIAAELMLLDYAEVSSSMPASYDFYSQGMSSAPLFVDPAWSLQAYRSSAEQEKNEKWDELEKSIIANIADDVLVGIQGKKVDIIVKKVF
ncbi:MAG: hypothetical protein IJS09_02805 [Treponema sp.]|nr:hypothetical protein [Treponema sp.]